MTFVIISVVCLGGIYIYSQNQYVEITNGHITEGENHWDRFKVKTGKGRVASICIRTNYNGKDYDSTLSYDGESYTYHDALEGDVVVRKYLIDDTGKLPMATSASRLIAIADHPYSIKKLADKILGNDVDAKEDAYLIMIN